MTATMLTERDWLLRAEIYAHFVAQGRAPTAGEMALHLGGTEEDLQAAFRRLHEAHQILLDEAGAIRMANPLAGQPTDYAVLSSDGRHSGGCCLWANCAWDALGVSAMLAQDARIVAKHPNTGEELHFAVEKGELRAPKSWLVHFALPVRRWYDDLIHT